MTSTALERRYRRLLRVLPPAYRAAWEEEMVTTFLEGMRADDPERAEYLADYGRPSVTETASVLALAVRLRLPAARMLRGDGVSARDVVWGDAVRLAALVAMLVHASSAASTLLTGLWLSGRAPWLGAQPPESDFVLHDPWFRAAGLTAVLWLPAYLALVTGQRRVGQILAALTVTTSAAVLVLNPFQPFTASGFAFVLAGILTLLALAGFHRDAPPIRHRPWLIALPVALAAEAGLALLNLAVGVDTVPLLDPPAIYCAAAVVAAWALLGPRRATPAYRTLALGLLASVALAVRVLTLVDYAWYAPPAQRGSLLAFGAVEAVALAVVAVASMAATARSLRRRPTPA